MHVHAYGTCQVAWHVGVAYCEGLSRGVALPLPDVLAPLLRARQHVRCAVEVVEVVQKPEGLHRERVRRRGDATAPHGGYVDWLVLVRLRVLQLRRVSRGSDQGNALTREEHEVGWRWWWGWGRGWRKGWE